ncbi:succinylglutamate desuccinylase [Maribacter algarum]|uniref:Succinylglutamate desuccinylase n=1 Tax=Maribacter algarum (ex Zhang et al. 2020) TaxID=2578118 RepID=A0A5S3PQ09_9FLAO|nr:succinylglutamate desuccinylase/aspartoacylase family protein [Maribacter algarum]TMM56830.1 succinylglutamate desuccinylase [Maribacter algarum]
MVSKIFTLLVILFSTLSLIGQSSFETAYSEGSWPSVKNLQIDFYDNQENETFLPISIIKGNTEGPVFTMVAGVHGYEYPPIVAVQELLQEIKASALTGTLIVIPIASTNSFFTRTPFKNANDGVNLNGAFPGEVEGTVTQQIAHFITKEVIPKTNVFLDIHGGDASEDLLPFICYYNNEQKPEQTQLAKELSEVSGFEYIVSYPYTLKDNDPAKYVFKQAVQDGKTGLSIESGKLGNVQKDAVDLIKVGVYNMLDKMGMYDNAKRTDITHKHFNSQDYIRSPNQGIFYSDYKAGDSVEDGAVVGVIKDVFGKVTADIKAPKSGIILYKIGTPPVSKDETLICISSFDK